MIINLTGQAGAGKTSIAKELLKIIPNSINIDGDEIREIFNNKDYSENGRRNNIKNAYNIALFLEAKGYIPIISLISPYKDLREDLKNKTSVLEFYVYTSEIRGREEFFAKDYQKPTERFMPTNTTNKESTDIANEILVVFNNVKNKGVLNELLINKNRING